MAVPTHLTEGDYAKNFPESSDEFPSVTNEEHYIDAWLLNTVFNSILVMQAYLIEHIANIEAPVGADFMGDDGQLEIPVPAARYPNYKFAMAWDSNLLEENIMQDEVIFGVTGTLAAVSFSEVIEKDWDIVSTHTITSEVSHV